MGKKVYLNGFGRIGRQIVSSFPVLGGDLGKELEKRKQEDEKARSAARALYGMTNIYANMNAEERNEAVMRPLFCLELALLFIEESNAEIVALQLDSTKKSMRKIKEALRLLDKINTNSMPKPLREALRKTAETHRKKIFTHLFIFENTLKQELLNRKIYKQDSLMSTVAKVYIAVRFMDFVKSLDRQISAKFTQAAKIQSNYSTDQNVCIKEVSGGYAEILRIFNYPNDLYNYHVKLGWDILQKDILAAEIQTSQTLIINRNIESIMKWSLGVCANNM